MTVRDLMAKLRLGRAGRAGEAPSSPPEPADARRAAAVSAVPPSPDRGQAETWPGSHARKSGEGTLPSSSTPSPQTASPWREAGRGTASSDPSTRRPSHSSDSNPERAASAATPSLPSLDSVLPPEVGAWDGRKATAPGAAFDAERAAAAAAATPAPPTATLTPRPPPPSPAGGAPEPSLDASAIPAIGGGTGAADVAAAARRSFGGPGPATVPVPALRLASLASGSESDDEGMGGQRAGTRAAAPMPTSPRDSTATAGGRRSSLSSQGTTLSSSAGTARSSFAAEATPADPAWAAHRPGGAGGPMAALLRPPSRAPTPAPGTAEEALASARLPAELWPAAAAFALVPSDTPLPMGMLARLWGLVAQAGGDLGAASAAAESVASALAAAGAAKVARLGDGSAWALPAAGLHTALIAARDGGPPAEHAALVAAYAASTPSLEGEGGAPSPPGPLPPGPLPPGPRRAARLAATPDDGYWMPNAGHHLASAGDGATLARLLADPDWLDAKLRSYGAAAVTADFRRALAPSLAAADPAMARRPPDGSSPAPIDAARLALAAFQMAAPAAAAAPTARGVLRSQMAGRLAAAPPGVLAPPSPAVLAAHAPADPPAPPPGAPAPPPPAVGLSPRAPTLEQAGGLARLTLRGHTGAVGRALVLPNGVDVATGAADGSVRVFDLEVGDCVLRLAGHAGPVTDLAVDAGGRLLLSAGADGRARVWELGGGRCVRELAGHTGPIHAAALDGRGRLALTAGADGALRAWDVERGTCAAALVGHGGAGVRALALAPDGRTALTGGEDFCGVVWDVMAGCAATRLEGHTGWVVGVALTPGGEAALTASHDGTARVWWLGHGGCCEHVLAGHTGRLSAVRVSGGAGGSPDVALTAADDGTARLWDWRAGRCLRVLGSPAASAWLADAALVAGPPAPGAGVAVTAAGDGTATVWSLDAPPGAPPAAVMRGHAGPVRAAALTRRGRFAVTAGDDCTARVWDLDARPASLRSPPKHGVAVTCVAAVGGGGQGAAGRPGMFLSVGGDGVLAWRADSGAGSAAPLPGGASPARWARGSGDGVVLAAAPDTGLRAWRLEGGALTLACVVPGRPGTRVRAFDAAPAAGAALVAAYDSSVWAVHFGSGLEACHGAASPATPEIVCLQTRGGALERAGADGASGRGHAGVTCARLSADGCTALTAAVDGSVRVWNARTGACLAALGRGPHGDAACGASLAFDGRAAVTVSEDGVAAAWDLGSLLDGGKSPGPPPPPGARLAKGLRVAGARLCPSGRATLVWGAGRTAGTPPAAELWHLGAASGPVPGPGPYRLAALDPPAGGVAAAAWSACGRAAALASPDGTVRVYRAGCSTSGAVRFSGPAGALAGVFMADSRPTAAAFDVPDGGGAPTSLAVACDDGTVHVLDVACLGWA